jgi:hypothetical protein
MFKIAGDFLKSFTIPPFLYSSFFGVISHYSLLSEYKLKYGRECMDCAPAWTMIGVMFWFVCSAIYFFINNGLMLALQSYLKLQYQIAFPVFSAVSILFIFTVLFVTLRGEEAPDWLFLTCAVCTINSMWFLLGSSRRAR